MLFFRRRAQRCLSAINHRFMSSKALDNPRLQIGFRGDHPYGSREYLLLEPIRPEAAEDDEKKSYGVMRYNGVDNRILCSLSANRNILFGAKAEPPLRVLQACRKLLPTALTDAASNGEMPMAYAALYGLCDYVKAGLSGNAKLPALEKYADDAQMLECVTAIATREPRPGHSVLGQGTYRDGTAGWEALVREYAGSGLCEECNLYRSAAGEITHVQIVADTQPKYLQSAGGSMATFVFHSIPSADDDDDASKQQ